MAEKSKTKKKPSKRRNIDWVAIEREYRAGQLSNVEIGKRYNVSEGAIRKKAKQKNWKKDLSGKVRNRVREKLVREEVRNPNADDENIIEETADRGAKVIRLHRKDIKSLRKLESKLIKELVENPTKLYLSTYKGKIIEKTVGLTASEKSMAANNLANVQHKRIQLERQAFNLNGNDGDIEDPIGQILNEIAKRTIKLVKDK